MSQDQHTALTSIRTDAYNELFGCAPLTVFRPSDLFAKPDEQFPIDVFVYEQDTKAGHIEVAVTNGMSDQRLAVPDYTYEWHRRELIQYFRECTVGHARRLHDMAWLPLFDGFYLDSHHSIAWEHAAVSGTPWTHAFFLSPLINHHREYAFELESDKVSFRWHIPISDLERAFKLEHGGDALIERMDAVNMPWIFDESNRPSLLA